METFLVVTAVVVVLLLTGTIKLDFSYTSSSGTVKRLHVGWKDKEQS